MGSPLVSIIVPVYNTEKYISECITSILQQSFKDFELILINDGSTDNSLFECQIWAEKESRIQLIDIQNGGVGNARNIGIEVAKGKWITFIDSDDYVGSDYLERMVDFCQNDIDFIQSGIIFFNSDTGDEISRETLTEGLCLDRNNPEQSFTMATLPLITSPVSKLYRREILDTYNIRFATNLTIGEDRDFNLAYVSVIKRSFSLAYAGYYYRKGISGNLSSNKDYIQLLNWDIEYCNNLKKFFDTNRCDTIITDKYLAHRIFNIYNDRLLQYANTPRRQLHEFVIILKSIISQKEYGWLCRHFNLVNCNRIAEFVYRSRMPLLIFLYIRMLCFKK